MDYQKSSHNLKLLKIERLYLKKMLIPNLKILDLSLKNITKKTLDFFYLVQISFYHSVIIKITLCYDDTKTFVEYLLVTR